MPPRPELPVLAAIDVGTNAVRLEIARAELRGALETLHQERDPIRPGEGVFATGEMPRATEDRLVATLRRYAALCRTYRAQVRVVGTAALRDAKNHHAVVERVRAEAGLELEVVSGREEARLICLGVLHGAPPRARSLLVDIGGGSTEVALARGERPEALWSLPLGAVRLTELFETGGKVPPRRLRLLRGHVAEALRHALPPLPRGAPRTALGSSGTINAVVAYAAAPGTAHVTRKALARAVEALAAMGPDKRKKHFDARRADVVVAGAAVLEGVMAHLGLESLAGVGRGLRDGVLVDLLRRVEGLPDASVVDGALALARRFDVDLRHARHVARLAVSLFDALAPLHGLAASTRAWLEAAALVHEVGQAVSVERYHKHTYYLVQHADLPGLTERERELVARVARYHRRAPPEPGHAGLAGLSAPETRCVRRLATLLRLACSLDRSRQGLVRQVRARRGAGGGVHLELEARGELELELWDAEREAALFRRVFGARLTLGRRPG